MNTNSIGLFQNEERKNESSIRCLSVLLNLLHLRSLYCLCAHAPHLAVTSLAPAISLCRICVTPLSTLGIGVLFLFLKQRNWCRELLLPLKRILIMENGELDGEIDFSNQDFFSNTNLDGQYLNNCSIDDSFFDLNDAHACTHTHTCNPPGPDFSHSHTCFHVHTKILPATSEDKVTADDSGESVDKKSKKRPTGNREAVRKYREKKKARAASLEDEVARLRALNQQLMKKLQGQAALEAEVARLKCLLVDIRGRIEGEIGSFPYQKPLKCADGIPNLPHQNLPGGYVMNPCELRCDDQVYCLQSGSESRGGVTDALSGQGLGACDLGSVPCMENFDSVFADLPDCGRGNAGQTFPNKRKGANRALNAV